MALVKCKECGKEISKDAETCPHCGKKINKTPWIAQVLVFIFLLWVFGVFNTNNKNDTSVQTNETIVENEKRETEIKEKLYKQLSPKIIQSIEDMEIKSQNKDYSISIYIKESYYESPQIIAKETVQGLLNILIAEGRSPYNEHIWIFAHANQRFKGATGQDKIGTFGTATYNCYDDSIEWKK